MIKFILSLFIFLTSLSDASGKTLVIATGEWPPYLSKTEEKYGCVGKLIIDSFKTQGITVQYTFFPWKRAYELAKAGQFDATAYWFDRPDRRKDFIFSDNHVSIEESFFFIRKKYSFDWKNYSDLKNKKIIVNRGYTYTKEFWSAVEKYKIKTIVSNDENQNFRLLNSKRGDITIISGKTGEKYLKALPEEIRFNIIKHPLPAVITKGYLLFSRKSKNGENYKKLFDKGFKLVMQDSKYRQKYLSSCSKL